ncbi:hypothetical protein FOC4_g10010099 [Fusarium odoratissimum]|uniref:DUF6594 domain-containing protein n=2 Tax=Fusarium oxysporum species complex TaxID=171631 RepID=N1S9R6_FUSC4|nr:hypothetical protein FOC4_g10010099 [Fusarium odoratissimum]TXC02819.1 hypothetical protein FocTR4_00015605 [Fusarium oxysporum f. sp. cubense]
MSSTTSDIELGQCNTTPLSRIGTSRRNWRFGWPNLAWPSSDISLPLSLFWNKSAPVMQLPQTVKVEDYPKGYPQFSSLISSHESFFVARRFLNVRARLLLLKQNRVVALESKLHKIDRDEERPLFLGSSQRDQNQDRAQVVAELDEALEDLDKFLLRSRQISELEQADPRAVTNLQNWVNGTGSIARAESRFLNYPPEELLSTSPRDESAMIGLENNVAENLLRVRDYFFPSYSPKVSRDSAHIYIPTRSSTAFISRALMTPIIVVVLLAPVILCSYLNNTSSRLFAVGGATVFFVAMISGGTRMKSQELIIAGATYATVLTVFLSESSVLPG